MPEYATYIVFAILITTLIVIFPLVYMVSTLFEPKQRDCGKSTCRRNRKSKYRRSVVSRRTGKVPPPPASPLKECGEEKSRSTNPSNTSARQHCGESPNHCRKSEPANPPKPQAGEGVEKNSPAPGRDEKVRDSHQRRPRKDRDDLPRLQAPERPEPQQRQNRRGRAQGVSPQVSGYKIRQPVE